MSPLIGCLIGHRGVAMSADGRYVTAVIEDSGIWQSSDFGSTWNVSNAPNKTWAGVASSAGAWWRWHANACSSAAHPFSPPSCSTSEVGGGQFIVLNAIGSNFDVE
jgi:hypothetical protein